jgi:nickel-dependent lactate racemase
MSQAMALKYDRRSIRLSLPDHAQRLDVEDPPMAVSPAMFANDLEPWLASMPLSGSRIAVVVADKTRLCAYEQYLPVLLERLADQGARPDHITIYIAYGTHPRQSDAESIPAYGNVFSQYRFVHHDCTDATLFRELGRTSRGTPVRLRRDILDSDCLITMGAISHHYFAGFGGGRKLIFPGLGQRDAIYHNHGLFLDQTQRRLTPGCMSGRLEDNPLAQDLAEIESHRPADLAIHGVMDSHGRVCRLLTGPAPDAFLKACRMHASRCEVIDSGSFDMVLASCGGFPKDINFIQAHKAVQHAAAFVRDGGQLIVLARCHDGIGSHTFLPWFEMGWDDAFDHLTRRYAGNGGTALSMMEKTRRIRIGLVTDLSADHCRTIGAQKLDETSAAALIRHAHGNLAVIPNASLLVRGRSTGLARSRQK